MAFDFPASPSNGQTFTPSGGPTYQWSSSTGAWLIVGASGAAFAGAVPPSNPMANQLWWENDTGNLFIWYDDGNSKQWVQVNTAGMNDRIASIPADLGLGFRPAGSPAGSANRLVFNDKPDFSGTDVMTVAESGPINITASGNPALFGISTNASLGSHTFNIGYQQAGSTPASLGAQLGFRGYDWNGANPGGIDFYGASAAGVTQQAASIDRAGNFSTIADITSGGGGFISSQAALVLAATGAGAIYLRPNGRNSSTGQVIVDTNGQVVAPGGCTATNGLLTAKAASGGNAHVQYQNNAGTTVGYCYADIGGSYMTLQNNFGSGASLQLTPAGGVLLSGTSNGYRGKAGSNGAISASCHNWYYVTTPAVQCWVDLTNMGNITLSSDYRIKKDVQPLGSTWETVKGLRPISYTQAEFTPPVQLEAAKAREAAGEKDIPPTPMVPADDILRYGFIAHELQEDLLPTAANGVKDAHDEIQSLNLAPVVAALTRALQEAMARIEALEAR